MSIVIFLVMMCAIMYRPFDLPLWVFSTLGALVCFVFGLCDMNNVAFVWSMVWDSTLTLIGLIILTAILERLGFFDFLAMVFIRLLGERYADNGAYHITRARFYVFLTLFGGFLGAFFANDGAILILTPLVLAVFKGLNNVATHTTNAHASTAKSYHLESKGVIDSTNQAYKHKHEHAQSPFTPLVVSLLIVAFVSDFSSNTFIISNLTNIITAQFFAIDSIHFTRFMLLPQCAILLVCLGFYALARCYLPPRFYLASHALTPPPLRVRIFGLCVLALLLCGVLCAKRLGVPLSSVVLACVLISLLYGRIYTKHMRIYSTIKHAPFGVVVFSLGLFLVVFSVYKSYPLHNLQNLTQNLWWLDMHTLSQSWQILVVGLGSSLGSSLINNLPMVMLGDLWLGELGFGGMASAVDSVGLDSVRLESMGLESMWQASESLIFAHLLGCNVGAKLTPIGSLATLLWLEGLRTHGVEIGFTRYMKVAFCVTLPTLLIALGTLIISTHALSA